MSGTVGGQGSGGVDLAVVARDDQLLDLLAARAGTPPDDQVAALLAAFVAEVDDGLAELLADTSGFGGLAAEGAPGVRRVRGLKVTSVALVFGATLSVSGVAAAVTGDPLAPYKGLISAMSGHDQLPEQAARVAALNRALNGTRKAIAHGDLAGARAQLDALTAQLNAMPELRKGERKALEARIAALEAALARAQAAPGHSPQAGADARTTSSGGSASRPSDAGSPSGAGQSDAHATSDGGATATSGPGEHSGPAGVASKPSKEPGTSTGRAGDSQSADDQGAPADATDTADDAGTTDGTATDGTTTDGTTTDGTATTDTTPTGTTGAGSTGQRGGRSDGSERTSTYGKS